MSEISEDEQPVEQPVDERAQAREAYDCPVCTANRGEECREHDGSPVDDLTHPERLARYEREQAAAPVLGRLTAVATGTVTKPDGTERQRESE